VLRLFCKEALPHLLLFIFQKHICLRYILQKRPNLCFFPNRLNLVEEAILPAGEHAGRRGPGRPRRHLRCCLLPPQYKAAAPNTASFSHKAAASPACDAGVLLLAAVCFLQRPAASPARRRSPARDGILLAREATKPILLQRCYANKKSLNLAISYILLSGHVFFKQD
jgi:hypothetical protein